LSNDDDEEASFIEQRKSGNRGIKEVVTRYNQQSEEI
jgi:hypothetical protein